MRVGQQLYGAFAIVLLLTGVVGAVGLVGLQRLDAQASVLSRKWLAGVGSSPAHARRCSRHATSRSGTSRAATGVPRRSTKTRSPPKPRAIGSATENLLALVASDEERRLLAAFQKSWTGYQQAQQKVIALARDRSARTRSTSATGRRARRSLPRRARSMR